MDNSNTQESSNNLRSFPLEEVSTFDENSSLQQEGSVFMDAMNSMPQELEEISLENSGIEPQDREQGIFLDLNGDKIANIVDMDEEYDGDIYANNLEDGVIPEISEVKYNVSRASPRLIHINDPEKNRSYRVPWQVMIKSLHASKKKLRLEFRTVRLPISFIKKRLFPDNAVSTTQYWWWNFIPIDFLPLNLFQQFKLVYNWFFIIVMLLSLIPSVTPINPITAILPVVFIFGVNMIKDFAEDLKRYMKDRQTNRQKVKVIRNGSVTEIPSKDIMVGDIISLTSDSVIPVDMVVISTSNPDNKCYVETAQLDGETNSKPKFGKQVLQKYNTEAQLSALKGEIRCNAPAIDIHKFDATISLTDDKGNQIEEYLDDSNIILKSCILKNTQQLYGIAVYTGEETKIMLNTSNRSWKMSFIDIRVNIILIGLIILHQIMCIIFVALSSVNQNSIARQSFYIVPSFDHSSDQIVNGRFVVFSYFTFFILLNLLVPMSLFVSLQLIKAIQAFFMQKDLQMYYEPEDTPMEATAIDLNADLAKIDIIFSDKTGTLTNNSMVFKKMGIGNGIIHDEIEYPGFIGKKLFEKFEVPNTGSVSVHGMGQPIPLQASLYYTPEDHTKIEGLVQRTLMMHYLLNMVICNDVIVDDGNFGGESPDEICLVTAAAQNGFKLIRQSDKKVEVEIDGKKHSFKKIYTIKFTADRKRMSVIVQYPRSFLQQFPWFRPANYNVFDPENKNIGPPVVCYTKGADSFMFLLLRKGRTQEEVRHIEELKRNSQRYLEKFSVEGLRTLLLAYRIVDVKDAETWRKRYIKASAPNSNTKVREKMMQKIESEMETDLELAGVTAIEDKLQEYVPETIEFILRAGIQFWVLTGDKRETARNVAQLAGIIKVDPLKLNLTTKVLDLEVLSKPAPTQESVQKALEATLTRAKEYREQGCEDICLIINGNLVGALEDFPACLNNFIQICDLCKTIIVCRAIPAHKASVVKLIEKKKGKRGLAIGDGANDVSMIQAATVGIGISGKEGSQARNAADYSIPRFHHLKRLLAVHGHYSLTRSALFVQYSFYKNIMLTFCEFFYEFYCLYSGQTIIDSWVLTIYNTIFTVAPPFVLGLFEKDMDEKDLEQNPHLYKNLRDARIGFEQTLSFPTFALWFFQSLYHAVIIFFIVIYATEPTSTESMLTDGLWSVSTIISINVFIMANVKVFIEMRYFTILSHLSIWISVILFFSFLFGYSGAPMLGGNGNMFFVVYWVLSHGKFYLITFLCITACIIPDLSIKAFKRAFFPAEWERIKLKNNSSSNWLTYFIKDKKPKETMKLGSTASIMNTEMQDMETLYEIQTSPKDHQHISNLDNGF
jgi:phospholipid-transporting ATPase